MTGGEAYGGNDVFNGRTYISWYLASQNATGGAGGYGQSTINWAWAVSWASGDNCHQIRNLTIIGNGGTRFANAGTEHAFDGSHVHTGIYPFVNTIGQGGFRSSSYTIDHDSSGNASVVLQASHQGSSGAFSTAYINTALPNIPQAGLNLGYQQSWRNVTAVTPPYGAPSYSISTTQNAHGVSLYYRLALNEKSSSDARPASSEVVTNFGSLTSLNSSDTASSTESTGVGTIRANVGVPSPRLWSNGDIPDATTDSQFNVNLYWRDVFKWLLGYTQPACHLVSTDTSFTTQNTYDTLPWNTEIFKVNGIIHATNDTKIYVPEDGWYEGVYQYAVDAAGTQTTASRELGLQKNGVVTAAGAFGVHETPAMSNDADQIIGGIGFKAYLLAGDYIELYFKSTASASTDKPLTGGTPSTNSYIHFWWASR